MQKILLVSAVCAASGFTLEMPELPDLIGTVGKVFGGNFTLKMVEEPKVFLPKVSQIESMTREESMERFHWFFCVYVLIFLGVTFVGSVIMVVGPILKSRCLASSSDSAESSELLSSDSETCDLSVSSYEAVGPTFTALSVRTQRCLVLLSFGVTVSLSLVASLWSLKTGRLSKVTGLDWEVYLILFCSVGLALLVQAVWAVARLKPGHRFDSTAFAVAAFTSMAPIVSDFYDTLKDVIFGALCLQSEHLMIQILGVVSWLYLFLFHIWFWFQSFGNFRVREELDVWLFCITWLFCLISYFYLLCFLCSLAGGEDINQNFGPGWFVVIFTCLLFFLCFLRMLIEVEGGKFGRHGFAELASSHLSVLLTSPKVPGEWSGGCTATGCWEETVLPILYKQLTPSKRAHLLIENLPQAGFSVFFLLVEGGSFFVGVLNLLVPGVQILLTCLWFRPVLFAAAPALGKKLNRAMRNGDTVAAAFLWEEAELGHSDDLRLFGLILPRLTFFLDTLSRHGFNKDPTKLNEEELAMVQCIGQALFDSGQAKSCRCNLGELGAKVVAEAMATNSVTYELNLEANNMGDAGAQILAESLKINRSLRILRLGCNNIGAAGAEVLAESLKINITLTHLYLEQNNIVAAGALALAAGLLQNRGLRRLYLRLGSVGDEGRRALEDAEKTKKERGEDFRIWWF